MDEDGAGPLRVGEGLGQDVFHAASVQHDVRSVAAGGLADRSGTDGPYHRQPAADSNVAGFHILKFALNASGGIPSECRRAPAGSSPDSFEGVPAPVGGASY